MELELRHLRVICAVAEAGSVTTAAATLGLAQPALTAQLRRIEPADETVSYNGIAGYYRYQVHAYSGSGSYTLGVTAP